MRDDMEVVFHAIEPVEVAFFVFEYAPDVLEKRRAFFFVEGSFPLFGAENNLIQYLRVAAHRKHGLYDSTALRLGGCGRSCHRVSPGVIHVHPPLADVGGATRFLFSCAVGGFGGCSSLRLLPPHLFQFLHPLCEILRLLAAVDAVII